MKKHILIRLRFILIGFLIASLSFFLLWDKPSAALGAAIISVFLGSLIGVFLIIYFFLESISLFKKQKKMFGIVNLVIGLCLLISILFILNNTLFNIF